MIDKLIILLSLLLAISGCQPQTPHTRPIKLCTAAWYQMVELEISTSDGLGHGPDISSNEWKSVIEYRLGVRGNPEVPERSSSEWCHYINAFIE